MTAPAPRDEFTGLLSLAMRRHSARGVAEYCGVGRRTIFNWLARCHAPRRSHRQLELVRSLAKGDSHDERQLITLNQDYTAAKHGRGQILASLALAMGNALKPRGVDYTTKIDGSSRSQVLRLKSPALGEAVPLQFDMGIDRPRARLRLPSGSVAVSCDMLGVQQIAELLHKQPTGPAQWNLDTADDAVLRR